MGAPICLALVMEHAFPTGHALVMKDIMESAATQIARQSMGFFALEEVRLKAILFKTAV